MASGFPCVEILDVLQPAATFATPDFRPGGSTPAESVPVWDFDGTADEYLDFKCRLKGYAGSGLTFTLPFTSTATGNVRWGLAVRRLQVATDDIDTAHTYAYKTIDTAAPTTSGMLVLPTIGLTHGAEMDDWADGEVAIVRVRREASHANDTMNGTDAELWGLVGAET